MPADLPSSSACVVLRAQGRYGDAGDGCAPQQIHSRFRAQPPIARCVFLEGCARKEREATLRAYSSCPGERERGRGRGKSIVAKGQLFDGACNTLFILSPPPPWVSPRCLCPPFRRSLISQLGQSHFFKNSAKILAMFDQSELKSSFALILERREAILEDSRALAEAERSVLFPARRIV